MWGSNVIWYALLAVLVTMGIYGLFSGAGGSMPKPMPAAESPPPPRAAVSRSDRVPPMTAGRSPAEGTAEDAAKAFEALEREQEREMMEKPALPGDMVDLTNNPARP